MANEKIINLDKLKKFRQEYDTRLRGGSIPVGKAFVAEQIENVNDEVGSTQTNPFLFQGTGTDNNTTETPTAPVAKHLELRGNTVNWNQAVDSTNSSKWVTNSNATKSFSDGVTTMIATAKSGRIYQSTTRIIGHKYFVRADIKLTSSEQAADGKISFVIQTGIGIAISLPLEQTTDWQTLTYIFTAQSSGTKTYPSVQDDNTSNWQSIQIKNMMFIDLTQMYGAGNEPANVLAFNRDYPLPYYAYNVRGLKSCSSSKLITIGCNQLSGLNTFIKVIAGQTYELSGVSVGGYIQEYDGQQNLIKTSDEITSTTQIELTSNTHYVKVQATTYSNAMFRLYWNEAHEYVPYIKHEYDLPSVELRMAGSVYDTITPNGVYTQRIGSYTFTGNESGSIKSTDSETGFVTVRFSVLNSSGKSNGELLSSVAIKAPYASFVDTNSGYCFMSGSNAVDFNLGETSVEATLSKLVGTTIYFELGTPIVSEVSLFAENIEVDDFGTMEFVQSVDNEEPIIPQGNKFFYPADYVLFIDNMYNRSKDGGETSNAKNFVTQSELQQAVGDIDLSDYVTTNTDQTISGVKTFGAINCENQLFINVAGTNKFMLAGSFFASIGNLDLGVNSLKWKNLYLSANAFTRNLYLSNNIFNSNGSSTYALTLPDTTSWTSDKEIATTDIFAPTSVSLSDGGTITDNTLKTLIRNEQPIKLNGFTCYFSCDDGTNYQYVNTRYDSNANKNHINVITINKSTWVATFHTSDIAV